MEGFVLLAFIIWFIYMWNKKPKYPQTTQTPKQTTQHTMNQNMICPHCNTKGSVTTKQVKKKVGISGGQGNSSSIDMRNINVRNWFEP